MASTASEIELEIRAQVRLAENKAEVRKQAKETADKAVAFAQSIAPTLTDEQRAPNATPDEFKDSIHAEAGPDVDDMPSYRIVSDVPYARFLEYGTKYMHESATFAQTAAHFGGDMRHGVSVSDDDARGDEPA